MHMLVRVSVHSTDLYRAAHQVSRFIISSHFSASFLLPGVWAFISVWLHSQPSCWAFPLWGHVEICLWMSQKDAQTCQYLQNLLLSGRVWNQCWASLHIAFSCTALLPLLPVFEKYIGVIVFPQNTTQTPQPWRQGWDLLQDEKLKKQKAVC